MNVLLTGATGFVGKEVGKKLVNAGHKVFVISRSAAKARLECPFPCEVIEGELVKEALRDRRLPEIEAVIHLAGESVAESRWTEDKKKKIYESRVKGTQHLVESLKDSKLKAFVSTSAVGYYGERGDEILFESSPRGIGFLPDVCHDWERPVLLAEGKKSFPGCRYTIFRVGLVLGAFGGAMGKMLPAFRKGFGGAVGNGKQWMGWIHLEDLSNLYLQALTNSEFSGVYNAVAPGTTTNRDFSQRLAKALGKRLFLSVPETAIKIIFGEMAHVLLGSQRAEAQRLVRMGYHYQYETLERAFEQIASCFDGGNEVYFCEQYLPFPKAEIFPFFSEAKNLEKITPPMFEIHVLKASTETLQMGSLIDYRLKVRGLPMRWQTEILEWDPPHRFVDTQKKGPYSQWRHTHIFTEMGGGTLMTDMVRYRLPIGLLGWAIAGTAVAEDVDKIFHYRKEICSQMSFHRPKSVDLSVLQK